VALQSARRPLLRETKSLSAFHIGITVPLLAVLVRAVAGREWSGDDWHLLFWIAVVAAAELLPVPGWGGTQLTISLPLFIAVVLLFPPEIAALVIFLGSWDPREFKRQLTAERAIFNRSQAALAILAAGHVFHAIADLDSGWVVLLGAAAIATLVFELLNATFVAIAVSLERQTSVWSVYRDLAGGNVWDFLFFYVGLGLLGIPLARLYVEIPFGEWAVVFFLFPLLLAQQMFSRTQALTSVTNELKEREKVLSALSSRMAEERYDERKQIAGYLHDDLAQMLFRLGLQADSARSQIERGQTDKAVESLGNVEAIKDDSIKLVRGLIQDLDRSPLGRAGLATALTTLAGELSRDGRIRFHLDVAEIELPSPIQLLAYQIAREAAQNAVKHAEPVNVWISLQDEGGAPVLRVRDDGSGFDTSAPSPEGHFGLSIMRERADLAGASLGLDSLPAQGTEVKVVFHRTWVPSSDGQSSAPSDRQSAS
jgi:signal transduction histidine kinase